MRGSSAHPRPKLPRAPAAAPGRRNAAPRPPHASPSLRNQWHPADSGAAPPRWPMQTCDHVGDRGLGGNHDAELPQRRGDIVAPGCLRHLDQQPQRLDEAGILRCAGERVSRRPRKLNWRGGQDRPPPRPGTAPPPATFSTPAFCRASHVPSPPQTDRTNTGRAGCATATVPRVRHAAGSEFLSRWASTRPRPLSTCDRAAWKRERLLSFSLWPANLMNLL